MDPITGALIASGISGLWGSAQTIFANKYNSPVSQLRRLRKAGLPLSYMYQGRVNQQSGIPQLAIDSNLGTAQKMQLEQGQQRLDSDLQTAVVDRRKRWEDIGKTMLESGKVAKEIESLGYDNWKKKRYQEWGDQMSVNPRKNPDGTFQDHQNIWEEFQLEQDAKVVGNFVKRNEGRLKKVFADIEEYLQETKDDGVPFQASERKQQLQKVKQQIAHIVKQDEVLGQLINIRKLEEVLNKSMGEGINSKGDLEKGILWALLKLVSKLSL